MLLERHTTGKDATVHLTGSGSVHVRFVDAVDGRPVSALNYVTLIWTESTVPQSRSGNSTTGAGGAASGSEVVVPGLVPGASVRIEASFDAHCNALVELTGFTPGEARLVTTQVDRGRTAHGAIVDPDGAAVADVPVTAQIKRVPSSQSGVFQTSQLRGIQTQVLINGVIDARQFTLAHGSSTTIRSSGGRTVVTFLPQHTAMVRTAVSDQAGRFVLRGLAPEVTRLQVRFSPWHQETLELPARAEHVAPGTPPGASAVDTPVVLHAPGSGSADLQFRLPARTQLSGFELALRIGEGPWLRREDAVGSLFDEGTTMRLRGLPLVPCRLVASVRTVSTVPLALQPSEPSLTFDFVPDAGFPTFVQVDLTPLAPHR